MLSLLDDGSLSPEDSAAYLKLLQSDSSQSMDLQDEGLQRIQVDLQAATSQPHFWDEVSPQFQQSVLEKVRQLSRTTTLPTHSQVATNPSELGCDLSTVAKTEFTKSSLAAEPALREFLTPPQSTDEIGRLGNYRVLRKVGEGGMGIVFEAEDMHLQRRVALKTMLPKLATDSNCRQRFLKEAQAAARVEHDFLCPIYQVGEQDGVPFLAMPFLQGETLESAMRDCRLGIGEAVRIGVEIAEGLDAAHNAGLVHRDIKPSNIWLEKRANCETPRVKILDFGLARFESEEATLTQAGSIMGTPSYMSPEQARSLSVDARSDLYSFGAVIYEMLTQKRPFVGDSPLIVMTSVIMDDPKPPCEINDSIPAALSQLVMELLSKSPSDRPQTAKMVSTRMQTICELLLENRNAEVVEQSISQQPKESRFRPVFVPAVALACMGFIVFIAGILTFQNKDGSLEIVYEGDADLRLHDGGIQIFDSKNQLKYTLSPSEKNHSLPPGSYRVKVVGADGVKLETESFEMAQAGVFTLKATAQPAKKIETALPKSDDDDIPIPVVLDEKFFPGRLVFSDNFTDAGRSSIPLSENQKVENHRFVIQKLNSKLRERLQLHMGPDLDSSACYIRCRGFNSKPFLNFAVRQTGDKFRWLGLNNPKVGQWDINIHRRDQEYGTWFQKPSTLAETFSVADDRKIGQWTEFAVRWSLSTYDVWVNSRYVAGGALPSDELSIGKPKAFELCAIGLEPGDIQLEIDFVGVWDQSGLDGANALPPTLNRNK